MKILVFIFFIFTYYFADCQEIEETSLIGKTIRIGNLEIAQYDLPYQMAWNDAVTGCANLGDGWRLPTKAELMLLYQYKYQIKGLVNDYYWSSVEYDKDLVGCLGFNRASWLIYAKSGACCARAVRTYN